MNDVDYMATHAKALEIFPRPRIGGMLVIDGVRFDTSRYNQGADMLTVHTDDFEPRHPEVDETPEGHYVVFALDGSLNQVTFVSPKLRLAQEGCVSITIREGGTTDLIPRDVIEPLFIDTIWPAEVTELLCGD